MAANMFIKIGDIKGESTDKTHAGEIDVLSWSWGMSQSGTPHTGGGGAGKVSVQDISVTKFFDSATPPVMLACCNGNISRRPGSRCARLGQSLWSTSRSS